MGDVFEKLHKIASAYPCGSHHMVCDVEDIRAVIALHEGAEDCIEQLKSTIDAHAGQGMKMRSALEFYGAAETWQIPRNPRIGAIYPFVDRGKIARDALKGGA